jgi:predicted metal-dependent hydrolase
MSTLHFPPAAEEGVRLFNERQYFEAHDVLEEIWIDRTGVEKTFYQGLIQVAAGFYKVAVENQGGALSLLRKGLGKLRAARDLDSPLDIERLIRETEEALVEIDRLGQARIGEFDLREAPQMHRRDS